MMMTMRKRVLPLGMAIFLLLTALFPVWAIAGGEATPAEVPMESVSPYRIILTAPGGWTSGNGAVMKVSIADKDRLGWQKIEYRMNDGNWVDCENLFADGRAELEAGIIATGLDKPDGLARGADRIRKLLLRKTAIGACCPHALVLFVFQWISLLRLR